MSDSPLSAKIMPRRGAAKPSSLATAEILDSSSESDREEEPEWNAGRNKAGPSKRKLSKGRSTGSIVEQRETIDLERRKSSPLKKYSVKRKRRAAALADDGDTTASDDMAQSTGHVLESVSAPPRPRPRPKPKVKIAGTAATNEKEEKSKPKSDTGELCTVEDGEVSDLTPLSSPLDPLEASLSVAAPTVPSRPVRSHPMFASASKPRKEGEALVLNKPVVELHEVEEKWQLSRLGKYVWVRLEGKDSRIASVFCPRKPERGTETLWWPARIVDKSKHAAKVRLLGNLRTITVEEPSRDNIRSWLYNSIVRFTCYEDALQTCSASRSPKKRAKLSGPGKEAWEKAVEAQAHEAHSRDGAGAPSLDMDELPSASALLSATLRKTTSYPNLVSNAALTKKARSASRPRDRKRKREATEEAEEEIELEDVPDLVDPNNLHDLNTFEVGEPVLAREKRGKVYWPAKVLQYFPSPRRGEEAKYKVLYLDNTEAVIPLSYIAHPESPEFATCKLGEVESEVVDNTVDAEDEQEPDDLRSPSPSPQNPVPSRKEYNDLSIREQFSYIKPVLQAVIRNEYSPTKFTFNRFISNDKAFHGGLWKDTAAEGLMHPAQVAQLVSYLRWWALRGEGKGQGQRKAAKDDLEGDVTEAAEAVSSAGDVPDSVTTELLPSIPPSSPPLSERAASPGVELPPSSLVSVADALATQAAVEDGQEEKGDYADQMDTREDGEGTPTETTPPRVKGSAEYEAMTPFQRLNFCTSILKQEAIRQILLWRRGERTSTDLLSDDEEERLHQKGQELLEEQDWIADILRLRKKAEANWKESNPGIVPQDKTVSRKGRTVKRMNYEESD